MQGSPPIPDDDLTTLRVPYYLVANKKLPNELVGSLTKAIIEARRELTREYPLLAQISAPNTDKDVTDKDAYVPIHPGAATVFDGDEKTFFDQYGDLLFYGTMAAGTLTSLLAAAWKYMASEADEAQTQTHPLLRLSALAEDADGATTEAEIASIERRMDEIVAAELRKQAAGDRRAVEPVALALATRRVERLLSRRRALPDGGPSRPAAPVLRMHPPAAEPERGS